MMKQQTIRVMDSYGTFTGTIKRDVHISDDSYFDEYIEVNGQFFCVHKRDNSPYYHVVLDPLEIDVLLDLNTSHIEKELSSRIRPSYNRPRYNTVTAKKYKRSKTNPASFPFELTSESDNKRCIIHRVLYENKRDAWDRNYYIIINNCVFSVEKYLIEKYFKAEYAAKTAVELKNLTVDTFITR